MLSQVSLIGLYHSPWVVIDQLTFKLIHVCVQLLAACTPLDSHLCMLVNPIKHDRL